MSQIRFDRLLSNRGYCSRSEAQSILKHHEVLHDGAPVRKFDQKVNPALVTIDGEPIDPGEGLVILFHKPTGFVCSHKDKGRLIYELLPERWSRRNPPLSSVGRLDKETSGLLILTDDGQLNHKLTAPKKNVPKVYKVKVENPFSGEEETIFSAGTLMLEGEDTPVRPAHFEALSDDEGYLTIVEGRYHQVRRMFAAIGNTVTELHRCKIGALTLGDLDEGAWKILSEDDVKQLFTENEN